VVVTKNNSSIYFIGKNRNRRMFLAILSRIRSRILLGGSGDENERMCTSGVEVACMSERANES